MKCFFYDVWTIKGGIRHILFSSNPKDAEEIIIELYKKEKDKVLEVEKSIAPDETSIAMNLEGEEIEMTVRQWCHLFTFLKQRDVFLGISEYLEIDEYIDRRRH